MKKTISVFLIIAVLICNVNIYHVQAATNWFAVLTNAADVFVNTASPTEQSTLQLINDFLQTNGFASSIATSVSPASVDIIKYFASQIDASQANKTLQENIEAIRECVETGFTGGDSSVTFNNTLHNAIYNTANYYVDSTKPEKVYTCDLQQSTQYLNANQVFELSDMMDEHPEYYYGLKTNAQSIQYLVVIKPHNNMIYGVYMTNSGAWKAYTFYQALSHNGIITTQRFTAESSEDLDLYVWNTNEGKYVKESVTYPWNSNELDSFFFSSYSGQSTGSNNYYMYPKTLSKNNQYLEVFSSVNALSNYINTYGIGVNPYYYNNSVWSNFSNHTSGDYTVDNSNVNTVTYGDVISYVNDYHDTNNNYPDNSTVNTWIETTNNNNTGGGSGGGSGGSGDDSGGSGSGIVSILTALGKAIADLITGIAAFLAEVVGGLVEAITGLLDTLTDLITNFTESIPNIFSPLLGWLFDGLPEEFTAIILLGLTACVIASIIKILRG